MVAKVKILFEIHKFRKEIRTFAPEIKNFFHIENI